MKYGSSRICFKAVWATSALVIISASITVCNGNSCCKINLFSFSGLFLNRLLSNFHLSNIYMLNSSQPVISLQAIHRKYCFERLPFINV